MKNINNKFLVDTQWLSNHLHDDNIVIVDCQWDENAYIKAHIPNAIMRPGHSFLKSERNGEIGKYLPSADEFSNLMNEAGIDADTEVICYDEWDKTIVVHCQAGVRASFTFFCLKMLGYPEVKLYDGSMGEWATVDHTPLVT